MKLSFIQSNIKCILVNHVKTFLLLSLLLFNSSVLKSNNKLTLKKIFMDNIFTPPGNQPVIPFHHSDFFILLNEYEHIIQYRYEDGKVADTLLTVNKLSENIPYILLEDISENDSIILFSTNVKAIYRHSYNAFYYYLDLKENNIHAVYDTNHIKTATLSPDNQHIGFVKDNDLFIFNTSNKETEKITHDGEKNKILNGVPTWAYEEEFTLKKAYEWSPDGSKIAYLKFDESKVGEFTITKYDSVYPSVKTYKYPKAGHKVSDVSVFIYDLKSGQHKKVALDSTTYIPRIKWTPWNELGIMSLNRLQNHMQIFLANPSNGKTKKIYAEKSSYYISSDYNNQMLFTEDKKLIKTSDKDGYKHLYQISINNGEEKQITSGNWNVSELLYYNETEEEIIFTSFKDNIFEKHIYSYKINDPSPSRISSEPGCHHAIFNHNHTKFLDIFSSVKKPELFCLYEKSGREIKTLTDNASIQDSMKQYQFTNIELSRLSMDSILLNTFIIRPSGFDSTKKYPLFIYTYGAPEMRIVKNEWLYYFPWFQYLAQKGYFVIGIDNRTTGGRSAQLNKSSYKNLGKIETNDILKATKHYASLPYIDSTKLSIFGWSYGGYLATLCLERDSIFNTGIVVSPVTDWKFYDAIYTERYMQTPELNPEGYKSGSTLESASSLSGRLFLIHGTYDDNVHLQNTMALSKILIQNNIDYNIFLYPDKNHSISGNKIRYDLFRRITDFIF